MLQIANGCASTAPTKNASGYFLFTNSTREAVQKEIGSKAFGAVARMQSDRWKTMPEEEKAKYMKQAADGKAQYEKDLAAFKEAGGVAGQRRLDKKSAKQAKGDKAAKKESNADRPKQPAGGAYGVYVRKNRVEIAKSLPPGHKCTAVSKAAGELWKALSAEDKKPYEAGYQQHRAQYETDMKAWKEANAISADAKDDEEEEDDEQEKSSPQKAEAKKASPKKRTALDAKVRPEAPPAKKVALLGA